MNYGTNNERSPRGTDMLTSVFPSGSESEQGVSSLDKTSMYSKPLNSGAWGLLSLAAAPIGLHNGAQFATVSCVFVGYSASAASSCGYCGYLPM
ncbi:hypothetical protein MGG_16893 [Pyricularia oryzae 70-15]|uniref:Uncharacterized protein n=4 Tax=Pyricularia TaxID=48558 RepID=A0ABQ8NH58_PYRGI|nr:uncharacterized protein MGG_16893 [Pyricularia oryzae 70-15]ELQ38834.1 hypothetical protein OOU_Y34scaffold00526g32 [Pyricularia oryzae Y34]KAI6297044.1 hypothetical protein MCOR33_006500 [Pyricularia grisea]KAI6374516.1 hypothetical protein MCOR31_002691 [Pyricularia oryzae]EHA52987.1 hypothetical protein MGG_16893 [Pyricularia oryzae 70-15]KAI6390429.1 hypothetical protein MCOR20_011558 [Pyricularia oryzae]